jgi:MscS family membrane protein
MEWLNYNFWNNSVKDYLIFVGLLTGAWLFAWLVGRILQLYIVKRAKGTESRLDDLIAGVGVRPLKMIVFLAGLHAAVKSLTIPEWLANFVWPAFIVAWTIVGALSIVRLLNGILVHYVKRYALSHDDALYLQLTGMLRSAIGVTVWIIAGLFLIANLGFNVSSLLAGLGLGGVALAMASKDTLSNVFGSFTILVNGPFRIGESITYKDHSGTVEAIGLRETRIRTWDGNLVTVPNSLAPTSVVENISRRPSFRVKFNLGLVYDTQTAKIDRAKELINEAVAAEEGTGEKVNVHFVGFGESALELQVIYYIEDSDKILDGQHGVNRRIKESFEKEGIQMAYKTVTVKQS